MEKNNRRKENTAKSKKTNRNMKYILSCSKRFEDDKMDSNNISELHFNLPFKVGDTVWVVTDNMVTENKIWCIWYGSIQKRNEFFHSLMIKTQSGDFLASEIGKTLFLSNDEAQKALNV